LWADEHGLYLHFEALFLELIKMAKILSYLLDSFVIIPFIIFRNIPSYNSLTFYRRLTACYKIGQSDNALKQ